MRLQSGSVCTGSNRYGLHHEVWEVERAFACLSDDHIALRTPMVPHRKLIPDLWLSPVVVSRNCGVRSAPVFKRCYYSRCRCKSPRFARHPHVIFCKSGRFRVLTTQLFFRRLAWDSGPLAAGPFARFSGQRLMQKLRQPLHHCVKASARMPRPCWESAAHDFPVPAHVSKCLQHMKTVALRLAAIVLVLAHHMLCSVLQQ